MRSLHSLLIVAASTGLLLFQFQVVAAPPVAVFEDPVPLLVGGQPLATESPGYASPTMIDLDGDGLDDLVVGQFKRGKMQFCKNVGKAGTPQFDTSGWIETAGAPAEVPGVW